MTKMTIEIPDKEYKKLKLTVIELDVSIKDYVLDALHLKEKILTSNGKIKKKISSNTVKLLERKQKFTK